MKTIPNLTALRFFLAVLVMIFHIPQFCEKRGLPFFNSLPIFNKGTESVYMFFSLSGFLIIRQLYLEKKEKDSISLYSFFARRMLRIFPLYYLVLLMGFLYYQIVLPYLGYNFENNYSLTKGILLTCTFFANIFATYSPGGMIEMLWSISIEEQFYLLIAPLLFFVPAKKMIAFLFFFTTLYFCLYFSDYILFLNKYRMLFFYFSFSGLCAILLFNPFVKEKIKYLKIPVLIVFLCYFTTDFFINNLQTIIYHLFSLILFAITIAVLSLKPVPLLNNSKLNYLGKLSYGIYMYHGFVMQFIGLIYLKFSLSNYTPIAVTIIIYNLLTLVITIFSAFLSYKYYEGYFLNLKNKYSPLASKNKT